MWPWAAPQPSALRAYVGYSSTIISVTAREWGELFGFVAWKLVALLGARGVLPFASDLCNPERFRGLTLERQAG